MDIETIIKDSNQSMTPIMRKSIMSKTIIKPGQIMRLVNKGKLANRIAGGIYRCQKCNCRIDTESPTFHQNGSYVHCDACDAQVLYYRVIFQ